MLQNGNKKLQKINSQLPDENLLFCHNSVNETLKYLTKDLNKILIDSELMYKLIKKVSFSKFRTIYKRYTWFRYRRKDW